MIRSFKGKFAELLFERELPRGFPAELVSSAHRRLRAIHAAHELRDLASPPGNRLEELHGDRRGQHAIRINDKWRICFVWTDGGAEDVEVVDYH